jgi:hypothetical protein
VYTLKATYYPFDSLPRLPWYINNPNPLLSKAHLTILNLNNFQMIEAIGLKIIALRSP